MRHTSAPLPAELAELALEHGAASFMGLAGFFKSFKGSHHVFWHDQAFNPADGSRGSKPKLD
jgi:hypothetical protein